MARQAQQETLSVTPERAAQLLGISRNLCYRMIRNGSIPAIRLGDSRRWLVPLVALKEMLRDAEHYK